MNELLRLLSEFGASDEITALAERFSAPAPEGDDAPTVEPLSYEELDTLLAALIALADEPEASVALLTAAADGAVAVRDEQTARVAAAEAEEAEIAEQRARLLGAPEVVAEDEEAPVEEAEVVEPEPEPEPEVEVEPEEAVAEPEPVMAAAARRSAARRDLAARRPQSAAPAPEVDRDRAHITIAADVPDFSPGQTVASLRDVDRAMFARLGSFRGSSGRKVGKGDGTADWLTVASIHGVYPENRRLTDDPVRNTNLIQDALREATTPKALVASGGLCAPLTPFYGIQTLGNTRRPVKDSIPGFQGGSGRGGVISMAPLTLANVAGASIIWTEAMDESATDGNPSKPCIRVNCTSPRSTEIYAVPMCLEFGNMRARTFSEFDNAASELALVAHARVAEIQMIADIQTASLNLTDEDTTVSAYRDWLAMLIQAASTYRARVRDDDLMFRAITTSQAPAIFSTDFLRGMAGGIGYNEVLRRGKAEIAGDLAAHGISVTYSPDMNIPGPQGVAPLADLPPKIDTAFFPEGAFVVLDQGRLDLGVVRDSTLNSTNDFQVFAEDFEAVHHLGHESYWLSVNVCPSGAVNGTLDPAALCASYT